MATDERRGGGNFFYFMNFVNKLAPSIKKGTLSQIAAEPAQNSAGKIEQEVDLDSKSKFLETLSDEQLSHQIFTINS